ncbi:MAG: LamG domain-containing protein [Leptolyngbya sp. BL-A-14]
MFTFPGTMLGSGTPPAGGGGYTADGVSYSNVRLLLHSEGSNGGSTFTDNSSYVHNIAPGGTPVTSTAQFKYGSSSIAFNGSTDYLILPNSAALSPGSGNWIYEAWIYMTAAGRYSWLNLQPTSPSFGNSILQLYLDSTYGFYLDDSYTGGASGTGGFSLNEWHYVCVSRSGTSTMQGWIDGTRRLNTSTASNYATVLSQARIGVDASGSAFFPGFMDEIRLTTGQSKDGSAVPDAAFPNS